jgi:peptidoglycan hydrolase-like protein with peptidoglycan-binding domain
MIRPTLRFGSHGADVSLLQSALNLWTASRLAQLVPDGQFGPKTTSKVKEYQGFCKLVPDAIVGPKTWGMLEALIAQLIGMATPPPGDKPAPALGDSVVAAAEAALLRWGWTTSSQPGPSNERIAAALCANPASPQRPRQGGMGLQKIFQDANAAGAYISRCPTITAAAVSKWQEMDAGNWRNANDLCAWCGIFCIYVYRTAGVHVPGGWAQHGKNVFDSTVFRRITDYSAVFPGCIGVVSGIAPGGRNHHFIVTSNGNDRMESIDGNAFGPDRNDKSKGNKSVIARNEYSYAALRQETAYFLAPVSAA